MQNVTVKMSMFTKFVTLVAKVNLVKLMRGSFQVYESELFLFLHRKILFKHNASIT